MENEMDDTAAIDLLESVLGKTGDLIAGVAPGQGGQPTPCPDYDVDALVDHIVGWVQVFAARANDEQYEGDASRYEAGDDPAAEFRAAADRVVAGWRARGFGRDVALPGDQAGEARGAFNMTAMEYVTHGWDLATATGQPVPYSDAEAEAVLGWAEGTLPPKYRGGDMPFGEIVEVPDDAPAIDRMVGFMGRRPRSS